MSASLTKSARSRPTSELYRTFGVPDDRSARARAEERLSAILDANPALAPDGWCDRPGAAADAVRHRARPDIILRPKLVDAFAWCRAFLALGCRRTPAVAWDRTTATRMAFQAEMAGLTINGRQLPVEQGVAIAAALSLDIEVAQRGTETWIGAHVVWEGRR